MSLQVTVSINKLINSDPMPGWVRALDSATSGLVTSNLTRENEQLNKKIQRLELQLARNIDIIPNTPTLSSPNERQPTPKEFWNVRYSILQFRYRGRGFIQSSYSVNIDIEELKETVKSQIRQISSEGEVGDIIKKCVYSTTLKASTEITPLFPSPCGEYRKGDLQHLSVYPEDIYLIQSWLKDKQVYDTDENGYTILAPLLN
ncbi:hypothetical protein [Agarivorans aestuarii]|uniref:hypothetical protein n=1 Tax=Agarivorans aestuarii TaxID=1563703 RepID=UPI001C821BAF|nr:hypothetical protein [Agarivorans aestuarii]